MNQNEEKIRRVVSAESLSNARTDADLVARYLAGDESAFEEIVSRHRSKVWAVAHGLLHNRADAEEIAQDTFVRAYRNLAKFRGESSLATWLHRIASNLAKNRYWYFFRRCRHRTLSLDQPINEDGDGTFSDLFANEEVDPARLRAQEEFSDLVVQCMSQLEPRQQEILFLRNVEQLAYDRIALQMGLNIGTVKSRIARARKQLRAHLSNACPEFAPQMDLADWFEPHRKAGGLVQTQS